MNGLPSTFINMLQHKDIILLLIIAHVTIVLSEMDPPLVLFIMYLAILIISVTAERGVRTKLLDFKVQSIPKHMEFKTTSDKKTTYVYKQSQKAWRVLPDLMPIKKVSRDCNALHPIIKFKGYTSVPQKAKIIERRHACHHRFKNDEKIIFGKERFHDFVHNHVKSMNFKGSEEINTEISPIDKAFNPENTIPKNKAGSVKRQQSDLEMSDSNVRGIKYRLNPKYRKYDSDESEDRKEFLFVNVPQIGFEYFNDDDLITARKRIVKRHRLFKRGVIEEENYATTVATFNPTEAELEFLSNFPFKNINV